MTLFGINNCTMYLVAGSNVFNQWFCTDKIFSEFRSVELNPISDIDFKEAKLVNINWSYNIFQIKNDFYMTGSWDGSESIKLVTLPNDCDHQDLAIVGNEYNVVLASKKENALWLSQFDAKTKFKRMSINTETPLEHALKKKKLSAVATLATGNNNNLYLTEAGDVYTGILPTFVNTDHCVGNISDIDCGNEHYLLLTDTGRVYTWGNGRRLQLGHGDVTNLDIPTEVEALSGIKIAKICAGGWHSLALSEFGDLYAWGWNDTGQLGVEEEGRNYNNFSFPTLVQLFDEDREIHLNVVDIGCGSRHSAIMLEDKSVWTTGFNKYGQLGICPEEYPSVNCFLKAYECEKESRIKCGPWTTVIVPK